MTSKLAFSCVALAVSTLLWSSLAKAEDLVLQPARDGALGAWLIAGPLRKTQQKTRFLPIDSTITDISDSDLKPSAGLEVGKGSPLRLITSAAEHLDLAETLKAPDSEAFVIAAAVLRATEPTQILLALGADDGVRVTVDGREVFTRDVSRPSRDDDDLFRLDLTRGDHPIVLRLHQRTGRWDLRVRMLDPATLLAPASVTLVAPGALSGNGAAIAASMANVSLDLLTLSDRYKPVLRVRFPGGAPTNAPLSVRASAWGVPKQGNRVPLFAVALGDVARTNRSVVDLQADLPPVMAAEVAQFEDDGSLEFEVELAGKVFKESRPVRAVVRRVLGRADQALSQLDQATQPLIDKEVLRATLQHSRDRLKEFIAIGDKDIGATTEEAVELERLLDRLQVGQDPIATARGAVRLAYRSPLDGKTHPFGVYVPSALSGARDKKWPMVVVLHGLNGKPLQMIRWFFGRDDPGQNGAWEDRHLGRLSELDAFVVSPSGFGSSGYRDAGEVDVMAVRDWAVQKFPIDPARVYVTGPSMGGIGTGAVALHFPDRFAAAAPLCGYHSYFLRNDLAGKRLRPWERALAEHYSNVWWAENGLHTPLYIVHGTRDLPEENSGVLIEKYKNLGYVVEDEHPDEGHNVWQKTYENFKAWHWLSRYKRDPEPRRVILKTSSPRYADNSWVHITELSSSLGWGQVDASLRGKSKIDSTTRGVEGVRFDRTTKNNAGALTLKIDTVSLEFAEGEALQAHRQNGVWTKGPAPQPTGLYKTRGLSGPISDVYQEPLLFVYGTKDPAFSRASHHVAKSIAEPPFGWEVRWPVIADVDLDDATAAAHSLFLIGNASTNAWLATIDEQLPVRVQGDSILAGGRRFQGRELGACFIFPNPRFPKRYVVVLEAPSVEGLFRGLSLPRLLPDFAIYDESVAPARGQLALGNASLIAAGLFDKQWRLPAEFEDPGRPKK